ncbi:MAG: hypothetical protein HW416_187 [Chloroflexi bacterium]|nr:hypothetical protein [Chloroflexota bacterium]
MTVQLSKRVAVPPDVMMRQIGEDAVILNLDTESYFGLDGVGTSMWTALTTAPTIEQAFEALLAEYDVDGERLLGDLCTLIEGLVEHGLIELMDA